MKKPHAGLAFEYSETQVSVPKADANLGHQAGAAPRHHPTYGYLAPAQHLAGSTLERYHRPSYFAFDSGTPLIKASLISFSICVRLESPVF